uniref:L-threonylcarbamoyladenylate synthase n=1 Tax=candidate division WOR-3 bacterium TaxID=2052148 RepID=A0A7C4U7U1_UNCW3
MKDKFINALLEKKIVGFPTDTVYGIGCILDKDAVNRLREIKKRDKDKPFAILIPDVKWLERFKLYIPDYGKKLIENMKGPLTILFKILDEKGLEYIVKDGKIGIRIPDDEFLRDVMLKIDKPIVATSANISGLKPAISSEELEVNVDFFIKGEAKKGIHSSVVDISGDKPVILRKGAKSILEIESITGDVLIGEGNTLNLLFVCSGNTCRSPMAEYHFKHLSKGYRFIVHSCGTLNIDGMPPSDNAIIVMKEIDIDIMEHRSRGITKDLIDLSDIILPMELKHKEILISIGVDKFKIFPYFKLLGLEGIRDPIGLSLSEYRKVRDLIVESNNILFDIFKNKFL